MKCFACESDYFTDTFAYNKEKQRMERAAISIAGRKYDLCPRCCRLFLLAVAWFDPKIVPEADIF